MTEPGGNMYGDAVSGVSNVFVGCEFDCVYCKPSFQAQMKRKKHVCELCYQYIPHLHYERLFQKLPKTEGDEFIWLVRGGDPWFMSEYEFDLLLDVIKKNPDKTFLIQTKEPFLFRLRVFPKNCLIGITLESNRFKWIINGEEKYYYECISKAPNILYRWTTFLEAMHPRKMVTIEPILDFDLEYFVEIIKAINPERIYIGYNSKPKRCKLPEPSLQKTTYLIESLENLGYKVKTKLLREREAAER